jgi:hypothetical protein
VTGTINSSFLFYYDRQHAAPQPARPIRVPVGVATWPMEIFSYVREWAERENNITRWTDMERGGHFSGGGGARAASRGNQGILPTAEIATRLDACVASPTGRETLPSVG